MTDYLAVARRALATLPGRPNKKYPNPPAVEKHRGPVANYPPLDNLPAWAARYEDMFGPGKHHRLLAYIRRRVRCPAGSGTLVDVKLDRCSVDMGDVDGQGKRKVRFYRPEEIEVLQ